MSRATVNGVRLFYELMGSGSIPLVLVHGSWDSHEDWTLVVPRLSKSFRVLTYDRRGHSQSERPPGQGSVRDDAADLAGLIEQLKLAPAFVIGNSFGAAIALRLAGERPDLFRGLIAHEPPLISLLDRDSDAAPALGDAMTRIRAVADRIASGDHVGAAAQFVETVSVGPGEWANIPLEYQRTLVENAPTFLDEVTDPDQTRIDLDRLRAFPHPALLTKGDQSAPFFAPVLDRVAEALPHREVLTVHGAGHVPHVTHPDAYVDVITAFVRRHL